MYNFYPLNHKMYNIFNIIYSVLISNHFILVRTMVASKPSLGTPCTKEEYNQSFIMHFEHTHVHTYG